MSTKRAKTEVNATLTQTSISPSSSSTRPAASSRASGVRGVDGIGLGGAAQRFDVSGGRREPLVAAGQQRDAGAALGEPSPWRGRSLPTLR